MAFSFHIPNKKVFIFRRVMRKVQYLTNHFEIAEKFNIVRPKHEDLEISKGLTITVLACK